jgi:hypothetical protein
MVNSLERWLVVVALLFQLGGQISLDRRFGDGACMTCSTTSKRTIRASASPAPDRFFFSPTAVVRRPMRWGDPEMEPQPGGSESGLDWGIPMSRFSNG